MGVRVTIRLPDGKTVDLEIPDELYELAELRATSECKTVGEVIHESIQEGIRIFLKAPKA